MEHRVFRAAVALVAVHAATDAFLAPEPGTSWRDHLARGAATLGLLGLSASAYARLRPGARAAVALTLGVLAAEGFGIAVADAARVGARGEDWTGFLLAPAALGLLAVGTATLWRSRKPGRGYVRRPLLAAGGLVFVSVVLAPVAMSIYATHRPRADSGRPDLGRAYRDVTLHTRDGLDLAAWYVPSRNGAAIVSFPTRKGKLAHARMLARHGYGVLLVDMRGYDGSDGDANAFGWGATRDIDAAVAWLQRRPEVRRVGGIGFSVGGEQLLEAAAQNPGLHAVVSEGAGERSVRDSLVRGARGWPVVPAMAVQTAALTVLAGRAPPPSLEDVVARISPRHVFLVYAEHGGGGEELTPQYFRAAHAPKAIWMVPGAGHTGGLTARPREYERRVVAFFDGSLLSRDAQATADDARRGTDA